ncbi:MAG: efflux RND transporter periplasmic adaptor subunit [Acidobacteria bacterium]|nr:MAG: efflux RND transporter periplasmic adaptor subunit [Acidobacteriota bacterium]
MKAKLVLLLAAAALAAGCARSHAAAAPPPPIPVVVATAQQQAVEVHTDWVATLSGYVNANIQPQVSGYLVKQDYREGSVVRKGQILFAIDPRPFQAALDETKGKLAQAEGQVVQATAQVAQARAQLGAATLDVNRDLPEAAARAIPQSQLQNDQQARLAARAAVAAAEANVVADKASVKAAQAGVEQAALNLGFTQVHSLITGVAGIAQVQIGNLVSPQTVLTTVSQLNPVKAYFSISAQDYLASAAHQHGAIDLLAPHGRAGVQLVLADGSIYPHPGTVLFADRAVNSDTGTIALAASFPNPGGLLRPGQPVKVRALTRVLARALVVPQSAVSEVQGGNEVAVVGADDRISIRPVQLGPTAGSGWVITSGLNPGERVVVEGTGKVRAGARVRPVTAASAGGAGE